jgi:hypothetical protein
MFLALHTFPRMLKMTLALLILFFTSIKLGLRPNESKTKVMKINAKRKQPIKIKDTNLEEAIMM